MGLTGKLLAMAAACAVGLTERQTKAHTRFNNLRTVNSYGEFVWQICRRKGHPVAVINRNGRHYYNLKLMPGFGSRSMHDDVTEFVMDVLCTEAGRMEEGLE
jgi:hypothetical protein